MSGSAAGGAVWIQAAGALVVLAVAVHCAARLAQVSRAAARPAAARPAAAWAGADALMALGLAAMLSPLGNPIPAAAGEVAFGLVVAGALAGTLTSREARGRATWVGHAVGGAAMAYMFATMSGGAFGLLTWVLVAYFAAFAVWSALATARGVSVGVVAVAGPGRTVPGIVLAPPMISLCHVVMATGMVTLLLAMR